MAISEKRMQIYLPKNTYGVLRKEARLESKSIAQVIREAINEYMEHHRVKTMKWETDTFNKIIGAGKGDPDLSVHHDQYIYGT